MNYKGFIFRGHWLIRVMKSWSPGQYLVHYGDPCTFFWAGWVVFDPNKPVRCRNWYIYWGTTPKIQISPPKYGGGRYYSEKLVTGIVSC